MSILATMTAALSAAFCGAAALAALARDARPSPRLVTVRARRRLR